MRPCTQRRWRGLLLLRQPDVQHFEPIVRRPRPCQVADCLDVHDPSLHVFHEHGSVWHHAIPIDDLCPWNERLCHVFRVFDHAAPSGSDGGGHEHDGQHSSSGTEESIHAVHAHFIGELFGVIHGLLKRIRCHGHILLRLLPEFRQFFEQLGDHAFDVLCESCDPSPSFDLVVFEPIDLGIRGVHHEGRGAHAMGANDRRVERGEIESANDFKVGPAIRIEHRRPFVFFRGSSSVFGALGVGAHESKRPRLPYQLTVHANLLTPIL